MPSVNPSRRTREGVVLVLVGICLIVLLGVVALILDGGFLLSERRSAQAAADAAALAAAGDLYNAEDQYDNPGKKNQALQTADDVAKKNFPDNTPPTVNASIIKPGYVQVIVTSNSQTFTFSAALGWNPRPAGARAVARGLQYPLKDGILLLGKTGRDLTVNGSGKDPLSLVVNNGSITVDSSANDAAKTNGNNSIVTVTGEGTINIVGGYNGNFSPTPNTGVPVVEDPLMFLQPPDINNPNSATYPGPLRSAQQYVAESDVTLDPGVYRGGIRTTGAKITLNPGIYYIQGGGIFDGGQGSITDLGKGVMIYNGPSEDGTSMGALEVKGQGSISLSPYTGDPYKGITFFQDRNFPNQPTLSVAGNGQMNMSGTIYVPSGQVSLAGNGIDNIASQLIAKSAVISGNGALNINWESDKVAYIRKFGLVE